MSLVYSPLLQKDLNWTELEYSLGKKYLKWEEVNLKWESVDLTWDEVFILLDVIKRRGGGSGYPYRDEYEKNNPWKQLNKDLGKESTEKIIKLYCKVRGIEYEKVKNPKEDVKVTINDFDRFLNESINIKVDLRK